MMNLLVFMKDNKPTVDLHEYHIPENYFDGMGIDANIEKVTIEDVKNFMKKYYSKDKLSKVVVFPKWNIF